MVDEHSPTTKGAVANPMFPIFPRDPAYHSNSSAIYTICTISSTSSLDECFPTSAMNSLSIQDNSQATPTPKTRKAHSESSLSTMTPPDSSRGASVILDSPESKSNGVTEHIFVKSQVDDDVFGRNTVITPGHGINAHSTTTAAIAKVQSNLATPISFKQAPRADRMNSPITPANAQGVLPPEACVFVANLAMIRSDEQLEIGCHEHFDIFGECLIKVRRDKHRHPFALVQYHSIENANNAIRNSRNITIDGRMIRCEHAQARRSVVITRVGGGPVTLEEVKDAVGGFGPIAQMYPTTNNDGRELGLPEGMWVEFAYYLDYKDAVKSFNSTTTEYRIHIPPEVETRTRPGPNGSPIIKGFRNSRSTTDQKSIFVGNLPAETTEHELRELFGDCGTIRTINIIHKPIHGGSGYNCFGFIEFSTVGEAEIAATMDVEVHGTKIRVEPKEYSARRHTRLQQHSPISSPYYRRQNQSQNQNYGPFYPQNVPVNYGPSFYAVQSPVHPNNVGVNGFGQVQIQTVNDMTPFHHQANFNSIYATPPPSARVGRRNEMLYTGSPHHGIATWSPFVTRGYNGGAMVQIPEELDGQRY